ncbi:MAG: transcription antitermination factor NusB [Bacteroidales bacterium]|nr:transcription antitermination factor NusB [Bacteroidales bacterium]
MISRRVLRIKILQLLYAYFQQTEASMDKFEKELFFSIQKTYDLYHYLLSLIIEIADYAYSRIEIAKQKKIPSREDLNPNTKFVDNRIIEMLRVNRQLCRYLNKTRLTWVNTPEIIKKLHNHIRMNAYFSEYMEDPETGFEQDKNLVIEIYTHDIANFEGVYQILEEQSIYWNDEVEFVISMISKTIKGFREEDGDNAGLMPLFKNTEDRDFAKTLFRKTVMHRNEYSHLIESYTENWDVDRIAFIDFLILAMAITEAVEFTSIPTRVTINEYIEIAKYYSTEKSGIFINGLLDKIFRHLKEEQVIRKAGRGLIGEV